MNFLRFFVSSRLRRGIQVTSILACASLVCAQPTPESGPGQPPTEAPPALPPEALALRPTEAPLSQPPTEAPDPAELYTQLELLNEFLSLSPQELQRIRNTVEMIERLSPQERERMRTRLAEMKLDLQNAGDALDFFADNLTPAEQGTFRRYWISLPAHERLRLRNELGDLPSEKRSAWLEGRLEAYRQHERSVIQRLQAAGN